MPVLIGTGVGLIGGITKMIRGGKQKKEARKILRENPMPEYQIPTEITEAANEGLPAQQYANAMKNIQRQQMQAIRSAQDRRSASGVIGKVQSNTNDAVGNLDVADAQARLAGKRQLAGYKDKAWDWNKRKKFERNYEYGQTLLGAGNENFYGGIDQGVSSLGQGAFGLMGGDEDDSGGGFLGGGSRGGSKGRAGKTTYYNGYNANSGYGDFVG